MWKVNCSEPKTGPCGTTMLKALVGDSTSVIHTHWEQPNGCDFIQETVFMDSLHLSLEKKLIFF